MKGRVRNRRGSRGFVARALLASALAALLLGLAPSAQAATGDINGTVTASATGSPLADAEVDLYDARGFAFETTTTGPAGGYSFLEVPEGDYEVGFRAGSSGVNVAPQFANGKATLQSADAIAVAANETTTVNAALPPGGQIVGTVDDGTQPLVGTEVMAFDASGTPVANTTTADGGGYTLSGLGTGDYTVQFVDPQGNLLTRFYKDRSSIDTADPVHVAVGMQTSGIDQTLPAGGEIDGHVTDGSGSVPPVSVTLYSSDGEQLQSTGLDDAGAYSFAGLETGTYYVGFSDDNGDLVSQFYNDKATLAAADPLVVHAGAAAITGIDAVMKPGGEIDGTVTSGGVALGSAEVDLYDASGRPIDQTETSGTDGSYSFTGLADGDYRVRFAAGGSGAVVAPQFYNGKATLASADVVAIAGGNTRGGIDAALSAGGSITGLVSDASGPLAGVDVQALDSQGNLAGEATTGSDGTYTIGGLATDSYVVGFFDFQNGYFAQYYSGAPSVATATPVSVTSGSTTPSIDAALALGGQISGRVTQNGGAVLDASVVVYDLSGQQVGGATTGDTGDYSVPGLRPGSYRVGFFPPFGSTAAAQYFDGSATLAGADQVVLTAGGSQSGVDADFSAGTGATISGMVADPAGLPLQNAEVDLYAANRGNATLTVFTNSDGTYTFSNVAAGTYKVGFQQFGRVSEFYMHEPSRPLATPITLAAGQSVGSIDGTLAPAGAISGTVVDSAGNGVPNASVEVYDAGGVLLSGASTTPRGTYTVGSLPPGAYEVGLFAPGFVDQFYSGKASIVSATPVAVFAATTTGGIDVTLAGAPTGTGAISGTVTDSAGRPLGDVRVNVYDAGGGFVHEEFTATDGTYAVTNLPVGSYRVGFDGGNRNGVGNYVPQFYNDAATLDSATPVAVTAGATTRNVDAALATGGVIAGEVKDQQGNPLPSVEVTLYDSAKSPVDFTSTDNDGGYDFQGLAAGTYYVGYDCCQQTDLAPHNSRDNFLNVLPQFYDGQDTLDTATSITVTLGVTDTLHDTVLLPGGRITGVVSSADGPLGGITVDLYDSNGNPLDEVATADDGSYELVGLQTGDYKVGFSDFSGTLATQYFQGQASLAAATLVHVVAGGVHPGVDATLAASGAISGTVTNAQGEPQGAVDVIVFDDAGTAVSFATTADDGTYTANGLVTGSDRVHFAAQSGTLNLLPQFYSDKFTIETADSVAVTDGQTTPNIDAALTSQARITGTVTDTAGHPLRDISITLYNASDGSIATTNLTDSAGVYEIGGIPDGDYKVGFDSGPGGADYLPQFYNDSPTLAGAATLTLTATNTQSGVDAQLSSGGEISGTVTDANGVPLAGVLVTAYDGNGNPLGETMTGADGTYIETKLDNGDYSVGFALAGYSGQFFDGEPDLAHADPVTVEIGSTTTGVDATLAAQSTLQVATQVAPTAIALGDSFNDTATVGAPPSGGPTPTGTVTFAVYGPSDTACAQTPVFTSTNDLDAAGTSATSDDFTALATGTLRVVASYSGDANYGPSAGACDDANESVTVGPATPTLATQASPGEVNLGDPFHDSATLTTPAGAPAPTGTVTFDVYAPADPTCAQTPSATATIPLDGAGAVSPDFTAATAGIYRVIATYSGDADYAAVTSACADPAEAVVAGKVPATISTQVAPATIALGASFQDTATFTPQAGGASPTGTVTFAAYGPGDPTCSGSPAITSTVAISGTTATSSNLTPSAAGTYQIVAMYGGDANYNAGSTACGDANEQVTVTAGSVALTTQVAPASIAVGGSFHDTATLQPPAGGPAPTGSVRFDVFGDAACSGTPTLSSTNPLNVAGTAAVSGTFAPTTAGAYHVVASYSGDASYAAATTACVDAAEAVTVTSPPPPAVTGLSPTAGPESGGTTVTITGTDLGGATGVAFGATPATGFSVVSATEVTATAPAGTGTVDVTVTTPGGTSATTAADAYTYVAPPPPGPPVVAGINPGSGATAGGVGVSISGTNLDGATSVHFGAAVASIVNANAAGTRLTVLAPPGTGTVDVTVTNQFGTSETSAADRFTYVVQPAVSGIGPTSGPAAGGTSVTITGSGFTGATAVLFGATPATAFTVDSPTQITATAPPGSGAVDILVTTPGGTSSSVAGDAFTYAAPPGGSTTGGTTTGTPASPPPPTAPKTGAPKVVTSSSEQFTATVNPQGQQTTVHFEYTTASGAAANLAAVTYDNRTPEQIVGSDFVDHTVTATVAGLVPNSDYHVRAVASNANGTTASPDATFTSATDPPPPAPVLGKVFNAEPVSGVVYVLLPGHGHVSSAHASAAKGVGFIPLTEARQLPVGTIFDATAGIAKLTTATAKKGATQSGTFGSGLFKLLQNRKQKGLSELALVIRPSALKKCATATRGQAQTAARKALPKTVLTLLRATAKGRFQTRGRYSSATVRGTSWTTSDRCDGTFTHVTRGVVVVTNTRRHRNIVLRAGKAYLAKKP